MLCRIMFTFLEDCRLLKKVDFSMVQLALGALMKAGIKNSRQSRTSPRLLSSHLRLDNGLRVTAGLGNPMQDRGEIS